LSGCGKTQDYHETTAGLISIALKSSHGFVHRFSQ